MSLSPQEKFLKKFHSELPGCTSQTMAQATDKEGHSSYQLLANIIPKTGAFKVLDVACGDGFLLAQLARREQLGLELFGIDMRKEELLAAEKRVGSAANLQLGRIQMLPYPDSSIDFVLCHMAFMLFDNIEEVIAEIERVLKPGGSFSAIVSAAGVQTPSQTIFRELHSKTLNKNEFEFLWKIGDPRTRSEEGMRSLFGHAQRFSAQKFDMRMHKDLDSAVLNYMSYYGPALLSQNERAQLESELRKSLEGLQDSRGLIACGHNIMKIEIQK